ncbi:hypothetical protein HRbin02_00355 [Candidatus Calditenuaceae archaeon HR02]|nr:hypothetical protein HRbin02_00355 [Candidatus Calditenuaceae archaeon HR02]
MAISRHGKVLALLMATSGVSLLLITLFSIWQHNNIMSEVMGDIINMPIHESMLFWMSVPLVAASLMLIIAAIAISLVQQKKRVDSGVVGLNDRESMVVGYLIERGGVAEQREIAKGLGLTRLQTHRIVSSLRNRNIVDVERYGRTNMVRLKADKVKQLGQRST